MSGMDGVIQSTLQVAQAFSQAAEALPDSLPGVYFATVTAFTAADIGADATYVTVAGTTAAGDGGYGVYVHSPSAGPGTGLVQSADGQWWLLVSSSGGTKGSVFLNIGFATFTSVTNSHCTTTSKVFLQAASADAALINPWISIVSNGSFGISHDPNSGSCTLAYLIV